MSVRSSKHKGRHSSQGFQSGSLWTWPFRKIRATWRHWGVGKGVLKSLSGTSRFFKRVMRFEGEDYTLRKKDGEVLIRTWPSKKTMSNPLWWVAWTGQFAWRWFLSRPFLPMLLAIPALIGLIGFGTAASFGARMPKASEAGNYKRLVMEAIDAEDWQAAAFCADALLEIYPNSEEHLYNRALIAESAGDDVKAKEIMTRLAVDNESAKAAMWIANSVGKLPEFSLWTPEQRNEYMRWVTQAIDNDPENRDPSPRKIKAQMLRTSGDFRGAYAMLLPIVDTDLDTTYAVTFLEKEMGLERESKERAQKLIRLLEDKLAAEPQATNTRIQLASMMAMIGQEQEAVALLVAGLTKATAQDEIKRLQTAVAEGLVLQSAKIRDTDPSPRGLMKRLQLLKDAMAVDATNASLLEAVTEACVEAAESKNNEMMVLREALVRGVSSDTAHFILGTIALNAGDIEDAKQHLEIAAKSNPNLPGLLNNLAFVMYQEESPDLERALRLSNAAVRNMPNHPYLRETRGQILLRLGRYTDAIADLEYALAANELRPQIRKGLAKAYDAIGQSEIAQRQRELGSQGK